MGYNETNNSNLTNRLKTIFKIAYYFFLYGFALAGLFFIGAFLLNRLNLTNVAGIVDRNDAFLRSQAVKNAATGTSPFAASAGMNFNDIQKQLDQLNGLKLSRIRIFCKLQALNLTAGGTAKQILSAYRQSRSDDLANKMISAAELRLPAESGYNSDKLVCETAGTGDTAMDLLVSDLPASASASAFAWTQDETWPALSEALAKDMKVINKAAAQAEVDPRLVAAATFAEQTRMFRTQRGLFKKYLAPLSILASANQFSLGVMGIKPNTAKEIEQHLTDASSVYFLGSDFQRLLDLPESNRDRARYDRLSSEKDHYYSYLYGSLYLAQIEKQWTDQGFPISDRPDILGTLFNIGFKHSQPNANPRVGGASVNINGTDYTFGSLVYEFYYSGELQEQFPLTVK